MTQNFTTMIFFTIAVGVALLIGGLLFFKDSPNKNSMSLLNPSQPIQDNLQQSIEDAERIMEEMNRFSQYMIEEVEKKHKELLFLYQLIYEKQEELKKYYPLEKCTDSIIPTQENKIEEIKSSLFAENNSRNKEILELYEQGHDISYIAKTLNMGQGEVQMIIGLTKMR